MTNKEDKTRKKNSIVNSLYLIGIIAVLYLAAAYSNFIANKFYPAQSPAAENITIEMKDNNSSILMRPDVEEESKYIYVLMPMKL